MEEIVGKGTEFVRGFGRDHGPMAAMLSATLFGLFVLCGFVGWFVGGSLSKSIDGNSEVIDKHAAAVTAMMRVVDRVGIQCQAGSWPPDPYREPRPYTGRYRGPQDGYEQAGTE